VCSVSRDDVQMNYKKIDWGIRSFVRELNDKGFRTIFSCAGHSGDDWGYVTILGYRKRYMTQLYRIVGKYKIIPLRASKGRLGWNFNKRYQTMIVTDITFPPKNLTKSPGYQGKM